MHAAYGKKSTVERQVIYHKARDMLRKAKLPKNGSCETILERWHTYSDSKKSISDEGWTEEKIQEYDALTLEDHSCDAPPAVRRRWQRNWIIILNHGAEGNVRQRLDFREAWLFFSTHFYLLVLVAQRMENGFWCPFCTLVTEVPETAVVSSRTLSFCFH